MPLLDILRRVGADVGITNYSTDAATKARLLELVNDAAEEVYEETDLPGVLREMYMQVPANYIIALPAFVGEIRGVRDQDLKRPYTLHDLRPRYHEHEWPSNWEGWRFIGYAALKADISNAAPMTLAIVSGGIDTTLTVTITGQTANEARVTDTITMSATSNVATKSFTAIDSIKANKLPSYDITVTDADDSEMAVLYTNNLETRYLLYDVSEYPAVGNCTGNTRLMEILYKMRLLRLVSDYDVFPVPEYDKIIAGKAVQLFTERQDGKEQRALMMHQKVEHLIKKKHQDKTGPIEKQINFAPDPLLGMFRYSWPTGRRMGGRYG